MNISQYQIKLNQLQQSRIVKTKKNALIKCAFQYDFTKSN